MQRNNTTNNNLPMQTMLHSEITLTDLILWVKQVRAKWQDTDPLSIHDQNMEAPPDPSLELIKTITTTAFSPLQTIIETEKLQLERYRRSTLLAAQELEIARQIAVENKYFNTEKCPGKEFYFISSEQRILEDLQTVYGGADDMNNEGYSSEEEYPSIQVKKLAVI